MQEPRAYDPDIRVRREIRHQPSEGVGAQPGVGIEQQHQVARGLTDPEIAGGTETTVVARGHEQRVGRMRGDETACLVGRCVVHDDGLQRSTVVAVGDRVETAGDLVGTVVGDDDDGDGGLRRGGHHSAFRACASRRAVAWVSAG